MKKNVRILAAVAVMILVTACGNAASQSAGQAQSKPAQSDGSAQTEQNTPDADWNLPDTIDMTAEVTEVFNNAMNGMTGVDYEPMGYMGEKDGVYCILCRATVVYPGATPYYTLVYVNDQGVQNIWDIWMGAHSEKKE